MKNLIFPILSVMVLLSSTAMAETSKSQQRLEKISSLISGGAPTTGITKIDTYTTSLYKTAQNTLSNGKELNALYNGVKSGTISNLSATAQAVALSSKIKNSSADIKENITLAKEAAPEIKNVKSIAKSALASKTLNANQAISSVVGEEVVSQANTVKEILSLLKK